MDVRFAFDNNQIINLLKKRASAAGSGKIEKAQEISKEIEDEVHHNIQDNRTP